MVTVGLLQVFIVDVRTSKAQIKVAVNKLYDIQTTKINTLIRSGSVHSATWQICSPFVVNKSHMRCACQVLLRKAYHAVLYCKLPGLTCASLCRPDGAKKAYVRLVSDYDALDIANKIGII